MSCDLIFGVSGPKPVNPYLFGTIQHRCWELCGVYGIPALRDIIKEVDFLPKPIDVKGQP